MAKQDKIDKKLKNEFFMVAIDYLYKEKLINSQEELAEKIGVGSPALSRIKNGSKEVSDKTIRKLNDAFGGIFNMAYFRGENVCMLVKDAMEAKIDPMQNQNESQSVLDQSSLINAVLAAKDETIEELRSRIADLKATIADKEAIIKDREAHIVALERQLAAAATSDLSHYPFSIGAADGHNLPDVSPNP